MPRHFVHRRAGLLFAFALLLAVVAAAMLPGFVSRASAAKTEPPTLRRVYDAMKNELSGQNALNNVAYVYRGWRTTGGPWFNQVVNWTGDQVAGMGFTAGENSSDFSYWIQSDYRSGSAWVPQYLSMEIVGPEGDANPADPTAYHFDHPAIDTFDPTGPYYPTYMTQQWVIDNMRTAAEEAIQDRCHLATSSAFTSPMNTDLTQADASATVADVVDVGTVTRSGSPPRHYWSNHSSTSLAGKILFSATAPMSSSRGASLMGLAAQEGAKAVMTPAALANYSDPVINGTEVYPNNVRYAGGGSSAAPTRVSLNISREDARFLTALCAKYDLSGGFPQMKLFAIGGTVPYSVAPDTTTMLRTLIVEIKGTTKADERVMMMAHVQEPGAEDNSSGVAQQLEMVRTYKHLIDTGVLPRPRRTMTFMWGNEMTMGDLYKASHPTEFNKIVAAFSNDMVGADKATTGAVYVIDKIPDPSARYKYQTDVLVGTTPPPPTQFLRSPDTHTLWGAGSLDFYPYPGHFLTDLYFAAGKVVDTQSPGFDTRYRLRPSPYEGGSDNDPFVWNYDGLIPNPIPALATFNFTDYTYHSSMDTMKAVSPETLRTVGLISAVFGYYRADADVKSAGEVLDIVQAAAHQRFGWEKDNSAGHFLWALGHPFGSPATVDAALHEAFTGIGNDDTRSIGETQILGEWDTWYREAVKSARTILNPADNTSAYDAHEAATLAAVAADAREAQANAAHLFAVSHFSGTSIAINGGVEWTNSQDVTLTLSAVSVAPGGVTGMRFSHNGKSWPATFQAYATSAAYTLPAGDGRKTVYVQFQDSEGNISDSVSASIKLDKTPPVIHLSMPKDGAAYVKNQAVKAVWSVSDAYSGVAGQSGTVANGALIDTASLGAKSFTVTATDVAGNTATRTVGYSVPFVSAGVLPPLSPSEIIVVKRGGVPVRFQLFDADGHSVEHARPVLRLAKSIHGVWGPEFNPVSATPPRNSNVFQYDAGAKQYIYNLNTRVLADGTYRLRIDLGQGGEIYAQIQVK